MNLFTPEIKTYRDLLARLGTATDAELNLPVFADDITRFIVTATPEYETHREIYGFKYRDKFFEDPYYFYEQVLYRAFQFTDDVAQLLVTNDEVFATDDYSIQDYCDEKAHEWIFSVVFFPIPGAANGL